MPPDGYEHKDGIKDVLVINGQIYVLVEGLHEHLVELMRSRETEEK